MENNVLKDTRKQFSKIGFRYFVGMIIFVGIQMGFLSVATWINPSVAEDSTARFLWMMIPMFVIGAPILYFMVSRIKVDEPVEKKKMTIGQWFAAFVMSYGIFMVSNYVGLGITGLIGLIKPEGVDNVIADVMGGLNPVGNFIVVVIGAPIVEEFIFRKLLIDRIAKYGEGLTILLSGFMFGLYHGNLNQFVYAFTLGIFLAFIYLKTRNVLHVISLHAVINFVGGFLATFLLEKSGYNAVMEAAANGASEAEILALSTEHALGMLVVSVFSISVIVIAIVGIVLLIVKRKKFVLNPATCQVPKGKRFTTSILNIGMGLYCIFWLVQIVMQLLA